MYYATVEGETEFWYFKWAESEINKALADTGRHVSLVCKIGKDPLKYIKGLINYPQHIYHVIDYESSEVVHQIPFIKTLDRMKEAEYHSKFTIYHLCYSNLTFEIWMILHKIECNAHVYHRKDYLKYIK
jgi:hypothetical protein